ncbi:MAG TPA: type II toxin-antitoxin system HicA family toxin [Spirochaetota bacterium]|nr:type II toxin-antitoxin system HicA family toxin [Spirochaetota bacterium]HOR43549.1 type II toxin-antitoxin system HicA family toxin [Spirochaetota bacterium]HPK55709.1 type II toxin-antitoxin system HicA family toxin [Spirochaetota bacterium]
MSLLRGGFIKYKELIKKLEAAGWKKIRTGKHAVYEKEGKIIPVPNHSRKEVPTGTCNKILKDAGIK